MEPGRPGSTQPGSNSRLDFCSKYRRKPLESYKQRRETLFMMKMITVSETKKLPGAELDEN